MPRTPNTQMTGRTVYDQFMWTLSARTYLYTVFNPKPNPIYRTDPNPNPTDPIKTDILPYRPFELAETWNEVASSECISMKSRVRLSVLSTKRLWASCSHSHRPPALAKSINRSWSRVNFKLTTSCGFLLVHRRSRESSRVCRGRNGVSVSVSPQVFVSPQWFGRSRVRLAACMTTLGKLFTPSTSHG